MIRVELYNSRVDNFITTPMITLQQLSKFQQSKRKMIFVLRAYNNDNSQYLQYVSYKFENVVEKLMSEMSICSYKEIENHFIITLEEGY